MANAFYYDDEPANPEVIWAEDLSSQFIPYETSMAYNEWTKFRAGNVFTISRPYIEGYYYTGMSIGQVNDNYWCWEPTDSKDEQSYTCRFRYDGDTDYNWSFTNQKEGSESDPIIVRINYAKSSSGPSTITVDANGGTIDGKPNRMYNYVDSYTFKVTEHIPTREGYVFDGWYKDAACTQIISPAADNGQTLNGASSMNESRMNLYVGTYGRQLIAEGVSHFCIYAKWAPVGAKHIADMDISGIVNKTFGDASFEQNPVIKDGTKTLVEGTDYRIIGYEGPTSATGGVQMFIQGIGSYRGIDVEWFSVERKPITFDFELEYDTVEYDGEWHRPAIKNFTCSEPGLEYNDENFTTSYSYNCDASTDERKAQVSIYAKTPYTSETVTKYFTITQRSVTPTIELGYTKTTYTGEGKYPSVIVKDGDKVLSSNYYTVDVVDNVEPGTATDIVTLKGNYVGAATATFEIVPVTKTFSVAVDEADYTNCVFENWYKRPKAIVKSGATVLTEGTDYELAYKDNFDAGTATIIASGLGAYAGSSGQGTFTIEQMDLTGINPYTRIADMRWTGQPVEPKPTISFYSDGYRTLAAGRDYTATYANNVDVGEATLTATGTGNYKGSFTIGFNIVQKDTELVDIATCTIHEMGSYVSTGKPIEAVPSIQNGYTYLTYGVDFTATWDNNVNPGTATVYITGKNDYTGTATATFTITEPAGGAKLANTLAASAKKATQTLAYDVANAQVIAVASAFTVTGAKGAVTYTKKSGDAGIAVAPNGDITVKAGQPIGSYPIVVTVAAAGNDEYSAGVKDVSLTVAVAKAPSTIKLAAQTKTYTGKKLAYSGKVTKTGSTGKVTYAYFSDAKCTKKVAAANVKNPGLYYVKATVAADANYAAATSAAAKFTVVPKGTTLSKVTAASKAFTAKWKKQATQTTGYQIQYALNKDFKSAKTVTVKGAKTTSKKISKLKAKKKYWVRVRTYKMVGKTNFYSAWSAAKTVTTKK